MNSLPKTVTRQRRGCDLNPGLSALESSTLTTQLPSHPNHYCSTCAGRSDMPQKGKKTRAKTAPQALDKTQTSETGAAAAAASQCIKENIWQLFATRRAGDTKLQYRPWPCTMVAMDGAMELSPCRLPAIVQKPAAGSPSPSCLPQRHPATVQTRADLLGPPRQLVHAYWLLILLPRDAMHPRY